MLTFAFKHRSIRPKFDRPGWRALIFTGKRDQALHALRRPNLKHFALWLAIAAVLLRALIPDGFMPEHRKGQAGMELAICWAGPLAALRADREFLKQVADRDHGQPGHHDTAGHVDCPFSSAAGPGLLTSIPNLPSLAAQIRPMSAFAASASLAASRLRPPSRAPPLNA